MAGGEWEWDPVTQKQKWVAYATTVQAAPAAAAPAAVGGGGELEWDPVTQQQKWVAYTTTAAPAPVTGGATYVVKPGESYASIAGKVYGDQRMFAELMKANGIYVLHPGDVLDLPPAYKDPFVSNVLAQAVGMAPSTAFDVTGKLGAEWWKGPTGWTNVPAGGEAPGALTAGYIVPPQPYTSEWYSAIYKGLQVPPPYGYSPIVPLGGGGGGGGGGGEISSTGRSDFYDTLVGMTNWRLTLG